jgi:hypothetical protein
MTREGDGEILLRATAREGDSERERERERERINLK